MFKTLKLYIFILFIPYFGFAQSQNRALNDTVPNFATLSEVSDTIPDIDFFGTDEPLPVTLKYDITSFIKNKSKGEYLDAELTINYRDLPPIVKNIRLKARGNFRRGQCIFPPIYLNFKTDKIINTELQGTKKIKIVTHCTSSKSSKTYLLREYLAYKLYNIISENSFRVRLLDITYIDTGKKQKHYEEYGFVIEPIELVAQRVDAVEVDGTFIKGETIIDRNADQVALFEYMIGNTDWRFKGGHNMKYLKSYNVVSDKVTAVPYDFDFSGFVNTYYAFPQEWTDLKDVRSREYLGYCRNSEDEYTELMNFFQDKKNEIQETIDSFELLNEKERKSLWNYINEFYNELSKPNYFISVLKGQCRTDF